MALGLRSLGKQVRIINGDAPPEHIAFIDPENRVEVIDEGATTADAHAADVHMILDTSAWGQLGPMADVLRESPAKRVIIDHHVSGDDLGATCFKDTSAEANGRLVLEALDALGVEITHDMAIPLYAAIATDTGWFRFPSGQRKDLPRGCATSSGRGSPLANFFEPLRSKHRWPHPTTWPHYG